MGTLISDLIPAYKRLDSQSLAMVISVEERAAGDITEDITEDIRIIVLRRIGGY